MSAWLALDALSLVSLCALLWMLRGIEAPARIRRLILPCIGGGAVFAAGDLAFRALEAFPTLAWTALLIGHAGYMTLPPAWFLMAVYVAERAGSQGAARAARSPWRYVPVAIALACFAALATNPLHGRYFALTASGGPGAPGAFWWAHESFSFCVLLLCIVISARVAVRTTSVARSYTSVIGAALALIGAAVFMLWPLGVEYGFSTRVLGIGSAGLVFSIGVASQRLFFVRALSFADVRAQDADALLLIDRLGFLVDANAPARALLPEATARMRGALGALSEQLRPLEPERLVDKPLEVALERGTPPSGIRCTLARGERRVLRVTATQLRDTLGQGGALLVRLHDETALFDAQQRSAEQAALLDVMWGLTGDAVLLIDRDGRVRYANEALARLLGTPRDALEGRDLAAMVENAPSGLRSMAIAAWALLERGFEVAQHDERTLPDGRVLQRTSMPLYRAGALFGRFSRIRDVTEERRSAEAQREAAKLESLAVLAGGVAHDFNNLLTAILGSAELAAREVPAQGRAAELLAELSRAAERGAELSSQLLAYAGRARRKLELVELSRLIEERSKLIGAAVPPRIAVELSLASGLARVRGDASQLTQIAMNLVLNAVESIGERPGRIRIATFPLDAAPLGIDAPAEAWVALQVADDGAGMTADTRARIFDPFFTTKLQGRGLGLASVHGIVGQHGGTIHVESAPGSGATFTIALPATHARSGAEPERARLPREASITRGGRLLIVDDDPATLRIATLVAESLGYQVIGAARPSEAIAAARAHAFRVALIDATMPECSGLELLQRLREEHDALPAIVYSGFARESLELPSEPPTEFLAKPFRREALEAALQRVLGARG